MSDPRPNVLFLDDDPRFLAGVRRALAAHRHTWNLCFFEDPHAALEHLVSLNAWVVVSDWQMPGMDGVSLCREIRRSETSAQRYVILLTGRRGGAAAAEALDAGADDFVGKPVEARELVARIRVGWRYVEAQSRLAELNRRLEQQASTDALTGLDNRRAAESALEEELARVDRDLQALSLCMVDVDHFKAINDTHGHAAGDAVLQQVARVLRATCRRYDRLARWGGEEFLVLCPEKSLQADDTVGARICQEVSRHPFELPDGSELRVTVSVGVARLACGGSGSADALLRAADDALYCAKAAGRDTACSADPEALSRTDPRAGEAGGR